jgi:hypothetical protein
MREGFDKEIDSLLRRTARSPAGARGNGAGASGPDSHLDADELAAFAEGALPEAARMNAVSHLADCGECRAHAVNLTRAAGVEAELEKSAAAAASSSSPSTARESGRARGWLATLFAPRTLRYVAPALVVCLVAAVSFIAIRSRRDGGMASLESSSNAGARPSIAAPQNSAQPSSEGLMNTNSSANANTASTATGVEGSSSSDKGLAGAPVPKPENKDAKEDAPDGSAPSEPARDKAPGTDREAASPPPVKETDDAPAPASPTEVAKSAPVDSPPASKSGEHMKAGPPPPAQTNDELASNDASQQQQQKRAGQSRNLEPQSPDGASRGRAGSAANNAASGGALAAPTARREHSTEDERRDADRSNAAEESRSVAGHRFRREGGAWVDVNYKPSMASTGVRRGTDRYRALVADIPDIGRIAEQLGGEVTVVVRGRAYHIQ